MPCNCGGQAAFVYQHTNPTNGQTKTYNTEIEAKAAAVRAGGGAVRAVKK